MAASKNLTKEPVSIKLPPALKKSVKSYAKGSHQSFDQAINDLVIKGLAEVNGSENPAPGASGGEIDWSQLKKIDPLFDFFKDLPDSVIDDIELSYRNNRGYDVS